MVVQIFCIFGSTAERNVQTIFHKYMIRISIRRQLPSHIFSAPPYFWYIHSESLCCAQRFPGSARSRFEAYSLRLKFVDCPTTLAGDACWAQTASIALSRTMHAVYLEADISVLLLKCNFTSAELHIPLYISSGSGLVQLTRLNPSVQVMTCSAFIRKFPFNSMRCFEYAISLLHSIYGAGIPFPYFLS